MQLSELKQMTLDQLHDVAKELNVTGYSKMKKHALVLKVLQAQTEHDGFMYREGVLEILPEAYGFLRLNGYLPNPEDVYVSQSQIRRFALRTGDTVSGQVRPPKESSPERHYSLLRIEAINGQEPDLARRRPEFEELVPVHPNQPLRLETTSKAYAARIIDLMAPIGKGQRGMIVAPPKAGKTTILKNIANGVTANCPGVSLIVLLLDERPEEVTDIERSVDGEVVSSTFDQPPENHLRVADLVLAKAQRLVECDKDVVILLDSLTRFGRASNLLVEGSGRTLSGGLDPAALYKPKRFFGAARAIEGGGSLTIIATVLVQTGSRMDEMIFEEFKATGNWEIVLDRTLSEKRIFPALDVRASGTRHEELLLSAQELRQSWHLRRVLNALGTEEATTRLLDGLRQTKSNSEFLELVQSSFKGERALDLS
jgi:transcription termination factor Rho